MNKNLRDTIKDTKGMPAPYEAKGFRLGSYTKTQKLITALYMVTDIIDKEEPIRNKLRTFGVEILSDILLARTVLASRVEAVMSFLEIAFTMNMVSEMNKNILISEFTQFKDLLIIPQDDPAWLEEFLSEPLLLNKEGAGGGNSLITTSPFGHSSSTRRRENSIGHTRIGVQKGSTLMRAISDIKDINKNDPAPYEAGSFRSGFDILKKERRFDIINIIKANSGNATITDIKTRATGVLVSCSEKTLQRELMSMIKDGVLDKTGEKRWSRYFVK